jgi:peptidoglycan/xylan/chitin deacetylase (PgdA/CDA1 family)
MTLTCHPMLRGRPARVRAIERLIEFAKSRGDVVFRRCDQIAAAVLAAPADPYACP